MTTNSTMAGGEQLNKNTYPLFLTKRHIGHIQKMLDLITKYRPEYKKLNWYIIREIDEQLGGDYPHNHTW